MSEALLEDMILSLDIDYDNNLDYKELAKGLSFWKKERRENRRKQISRESTMDSFKSRSSKLIDIFKELTTELRWIIIIFFFKFKYFSILGLKFVTIELHKNNYLRVEIQTWTIPCLIIKWSLILGVFLHVFIIEIDCLPLIRRLTFYLFIFIHKILCFQIF